MARINLADGGYYHAQGADEVCYYNNGVLCGLHAIQGGRDRYCCACGWNPVVEQERREKVRMLIDGKETTAQSASN